MDNEELNKKMEFIVEHQAKFAAELETMREVQVAESKLRNQEYQRLSGALISMVDIVGSLTRAQQRTEESLKVLTEAQARTDESLNNLIGVVERHISGNGGSHSHA